MYGNGEYYPPPTREECERYLRSVRPELRLGRYICAGGAGLVFELEGTPTPSVVKIVDSCFMARTKDYSAEAKELRMRMNAYIDREVELMCQLKSPHVMRLYDAVKISAPEGADRGDCVPVTLIFMPKLIALPKFIADVRKLTADEIVQMGLDIGEALKVCVKNKVVHRDVKPANIFVVKKDGRLRFVLGDFGASRRVEKLGEENVTAFGTPYYRAPEIVKRDTLNYYNSDIYSLGMAMFYLLSGAYAQTKRDAATGITTVKNPERIPPQLQAFIQKTLQVDPGHRFHTPEEMCAVLKAVGPINRWTGSGAPACVMAAKDALCHGKDIEALKFACESYKKHEKGSRRMLAYCLYRINPGDERVMALLQECFLEGDAIGILIRGMLLAEQGKRKQAAKDIRDAAASSQQCVPAWYYFGRFLYYGDFEGIAQDQSQGIMLVQRAAEQQFYPALRIMKRIRSEHPELKLPSELEQLLQKEYSRDNPLESQDIIRFL